MGIEITVWSVNATTPPTPVARAVEATELKTAVISGKCAVFDPAEGKHLPGYRYARDRLKPGNQITFPGKITENETTIVIPKSRSAVVQPDGCIDLTTKEKTT